MSGSQSMEKGERNLRVTDIQLKHTIKRLFDMLDIKGRDALDREEFREMLIFMTEDVFVSRGHFWNEEQPDQSRFLNVWNSLEKLEIPVKKESSVDWELTHEAMR